MESQSSNNQEPTLLNQKLNPKEDNIPHPHPNSPSSPLSSPSHDFSFTITLHPSPASTPTSFKHSKPSSSSSCAALDLSPADDIFFHGHLLPLHLLPSLPPRPSTDTICIENRALPTLPHETTNPNTQKKKPNPFFNLTKWLFKWSAHDDGKNDNYYNKRKKAIFDVKYYWKKMESLFFPPKGEKGKRDLRQRPYSFSGSSLNPRSGRDGWMRRRGEFSAPASMRTSPTNSGLLLGAAPPGFSSSSSSSESSMEELQSAIQAAIAHCKNSTAAKKEDLCKC